MEPFQIAILLFFAGLFHGLCRAFLDVGLEEGYEEGKKQSRTDFVFMKESAMRFGAYDMIFEPNFPEEKKERILNWVSHSPDQVIADRENFGPLIIDSVVS